MKQSLGPRTILFPAPALLVGTYGEEGRPTVMTAAWGGICCSKPPCVAVSLRAATQSHGHIMVRRAFTICVPTEDQVKEADFFGLVSGRSTDKFAVSGLTAVPSSLVDAPYVAECPVVLECRVLHVVEIGLHTQFIGEILDCKAEEAVLNERGEPVAGLVRPLVYAPVESAYYGLGPKVGEGFSAGKALKSSGE
jgi:flavin reductase (DIM6/NTAB) family NADH-FMN oxidoreductase RutF